MGNILEESQYFGMDSTLEWSLNAKNYLENVHGFSLFPIKFRQNPKLLSTVPDKPPAIIQHDTSKVLTNKLADLHKVRQAFILSKSREKIQRALNNNV